MIKKGKHHYALCVNYYSEIKTRKKHNILYRMPQWDEKA